MKLTVATWNVLADCYAHGQRRACAEDDASKKREAPSATNWSNRKLLLEHSLKECTADVICLQEVDHFADFYQACLTNLGYRSLYMQRPERKDGCVIAYKTEFLALTSVDRVNMNDAIVADSLYEYQKYQKNNVALSVKLEHIPSGKKFIVCTCHIHWNPCLPEVKSSQVLYLLQRLNAFCDNEDIPVVLTGDFNTLPEDAIYEAIIGPNNMTVLQQRLHQLKYGGDLYGPKTRFLCDASLNKLCKWLRVLGVNVALDAWDNGVPASSSKHKNKAKWQWSSCTATTSTNTTTPTNTTTIDALYTQEGSTLPTTTETSSEPPQPPAELSYAARVSSINAFFTRAEREKRVILTTSKTLRERASCPRNFYVNPQNLETGLIDICAQFGLALSRDRFLTVCGKCGDEVEEVNRNDPRLQDKYLPSDRTVFACVNCAQVRLILHNYILHSFLIYYTMNQFTYILYVCFLCIEALLVERESRQSASEGDGEGRAALPAHHRGTGAARNRLCMYWCRCECGSARGREAPSARWYLHSERLWPHCEKPEFEESVREHCRERQQERGAAAGNGATACTGGGG